MEREYVKVRVVNGAPSVAVKVPSVVGVPPLNVSVTVIVLFTALVGVVKEAAALPVAEAFGVAAVVLSQSAVAVFVPPVSGFGVAVYVHA